MFSKGNGLYIAYVDYVDGMATATSDSGKEVVVTVKMTLKRIASQNRSRYILIGYEDVPQRRRSTSHSTAQG